MENKTKSEVNGFVYFAVGVAALGSLLFGYDTGTISGAILLITKQFSLSSTMEEIVVSSVLVGTVVGATIGGVLTGRFGRRKMILLAGIIFTASSLGTALAPTVNWLIACRVVSGIGIGIASFISPMYIAELVPAKVRGAFVAVNMLAVTTGIIAAYLVDYALSDTYGWRYMFALATLPSTALVIGMWGLPDSPQWLISKSKVEQAKQILQRARTTSDVSSEIREVQKGIAKQGIGGIKGLLQHSLRMPLIIGIGLATFQQLSGINTVLFYAPTIFKFAGINGIGTAILAGAGLTLVMWIFHVPAIFLLDRIGRRPMLLTGLTGQFIGMAILGSAFNFHQLEDIKSYVAISGLMIYVSCFAFGLGPIFWPLISEIYPLNVRGSAMGVVTVINWTLNLIVAMTFLTLIGILGQGGIFWLYGFVAFAAWFFVYLLVPETKGKTLEQIGEKWK